ncbi:DHA2 family efflux MFS transporter permease subunit [Actinoallomurus sp. CA-142502]|uniref:DHA2 family efflux MFS transporter permease subunit n=1 Tax=Actinoallomurus sp. CA-142502 TaxID=3239885 RepID=UPI003D901BC9
MTTVAAPAEERIGRPVWRLALVIVFGAFASGLDGSLTNIGLDTIGADLHAGLDETQWVATGYLVALAVSLPLCGWLGRRLGPGRLWLMALVAFTAASGLCAAAPSIGWLIALRVAQGLGAGLLVPAGQTVIGQAVGAHRLGRVMSTLGIAVALAPALGPVVGGLVLHALSWPWLFLANLPIGAVGLALGLRYVPRGDRGAAGPLDRRGFALIGGGLPLLVYALTRWGSAGTPAAPSVAIPLVLGVAGLAAFVLRTRRREHPLMDLGLYRRPVYVAASGASALSGALMFGTALVFPLYFQILHHDRVVDTGLRMLALGLGTAVILPVAGRLTDRYGGGLVASWGGVAAVAVMVVFLLFGADADAEPVLVEALLVLLGMAVAATAVPPGIAAYQAVPPDRLPDATTQVNIVQRIGGALGGSLYAVALANALPGGGEHAFRVVFGWLTGSAVLALLCSQWLRIALRRAG